MLETPEQATTTVDVPSVGLSEELTFEVRVFDATLAASTAKVTLSAVTDVGAPVFLSTPSTVGAVNEPYHYDGDATVDIAGDRSTLTFSVMRAPPGFSVEKTTGVVTWTPTTETDFDRIAIIATNSDGQSAQTFSVRVHKRPQIVSTAQTQFLIGVPYSYGSDGGQPEAQGTKPLTWSLAAGPSGMRIDATTGRITWTPEAADDANVEIVVRNDTGEARQRFVVARPVRTAPMISRCANLQGSVRQPFLYNETGVVEVTGLAVGERISLEAIRAPTGTVLQPTRRQLGWMPNEPGTYDFALAIAAQIPSGADAPATSAVTLDHYAFTVTVGTLDDSSQRANAVLSAVPAVGPAPLPVLLDASLSTSSAGTRILQYVFFPGNGASTRTQQQQLAYQYERPGGYQSELEIWDSSGVIVGTKQSIVVTEGSKIPPHVRMTADTLEGTAPLAVQFGCDCSDEDGTLEVYVWQFGTDTLASTEEAPHFVFAQPGSYRVRLAVTDSDGLVGYDQVVVVVKYQDEWPPFARIVTSTLDSDAPAMAQLHADVRDPDGVVERLLWTLPDGQTSTEPDVQLTFEKPGYYITTLLAIDNDGLTAVDACTVTIRQSDQLPPRIVSAPWTIAHVGEPYRYDADNRLAAQGSRPLIWLLGKTVNNQVTNAPFGMSISAQSGAISWTPLAEQLGEQCITLMAANSAGTDLQEFVVNVDAGMPAAQSRTVTSAGSCSEPGDDMPAVSAAVLLAAAMLRGRRHQRGKVTT